MEPVFVGIILALLVFILLVVFLRLRYLRRFSTSGNIDLLASNIVREAEIKLLKNPKKGRQAREKALNDALKKLEQLESQIPPLRLRSKSLMGEKKSLVKSMFNLDPSLLKTNLMSRFPALKRQIEKRDQATIDFVGERNRNSGGFRRSF